MPRLIRLYIVSVAIGFALSVVFVGLLLAFDVGGLRRLILQSETGLLACAMMVVFNGVVFAGVQFAIAVMRLAEPDDDRPRGPGMRQGVPVPVPVPTRVMRPRR